MKWYDSPETLPGVVSNLMTSDSQRQYRFAAILRMYEPALVPEYMVNRFTVPISIQSETAKINIINSIIRHAVNYFGRSYPKPVFLPYGGKDVRDRADVSTNFVNGLFYTKDLYSNLRKSLLHAAIGGTGAIKVVEGFDDIYYETVLPTEIQVFKEEAEAGNIRSLFQVKHIDKEILKAQYPEFAPRIEQAKTADGCPTRIQVCEGWHLKSGPNEKDGVHQIVISPDIIVVNEEFTSDKFPISFFNYYDPPVGFWGEGLGQLLVPYQVKINQLLRNIEANIKAGGNLKIWLDKDSGISPDQFNNDLRGIMLVGRGNPPRHIVQPLVSAEILNHLDYLINNAWQAARFNPQQGVGQLPTGITSRVALLTVQDMQAEQHLMTGKQFNNHVLEIAELTMDAAKRIYERTGKMETFFKSGKKIEKISLEDALMNEDEFQIEIRASSRTRDSVAGRLELAEYLADRGIWNKEQVLEALDLPGIMDDLDAELAESRNIDAYLRSIEKGEKRPPHAYMNLELAKFKALKKYNQLEYEEASPTVLTLLSQFIQEVDIKLAEAQPSQPVQAEQQAQVAPEALPVAPLP